jgi:hypothetical protein
LLLLDINEKRIYGDEGEGGANVIHEFKSFILYPYQGFVVVYTHANHLSSYIVI